MAPTPSANFAYLAHHDARLVALATQAEEHFAGDPTLLEEAHDVLGPDGSHLGGDVLQDLFLGLCDRTLTFPDIRGAALPWLRRMVRSRAHEQLRARGGTCVPPDEAAE